MFANLEACSTPLSCINIDEDLPEYRRVAPLPARATISISPTCLVKNLPNAETAPQLLAQNTPRKRHRHSGASADDKRAPKGEVFQSITSAPEIRDRCFEELRVECYLQSLIATGVPPEPVIDTRLAIPPLYTPRTSSVSGVQDVTMSSDPLLTGGCSFAVNVSGNMGGAVPFGNTSESGVLPQGVSA